MTKSLKIIKYVRTHTIVSHLSKIFFNCFVEDGIEREKEKRE